jgi:hypothetical protein
MQMLLKGQYRCSVGLSSTDPASNLADWLPCAIIFQGLSQCCHSDLGKEFWNRPFYVPSSSHVPELHHSMMFNSYNFIAFLKEFKKLSRPAVKINSLFRLYWTWVNKFCFHSKRLLTLWGKGRGLCRPPPKIRGFFIGTRKSKSVILTILLCLYRLTQLKECIKFNLIYYFHNMFRPFFGHHQANTIVYQMFFWIAIILLLIWGHIYNNCSGGWQYWYSSISHIKLLHIKILKIVKNLN